MDLDHSLLLPYRRSDVEVFDYQLVGLRAEFIRPIVRPVVRLRQTPLNAYRSWYFRQSALVMHSRWLAESWFCHWISRSDQQTLFLKLIFNFWIYSSIFPHYVFIWNDLQILGHFKNDEKYFTLFWQLSNFWLKINYYIRI